MADTAPIFSLEIMEGPRKGSAIPLPEGDIVVGRGSHCGIALPHDEVAPTHFGLRVRANQVIVAPGGTIAKIYVNGRRVERAKLLRVGDILNVGPYHMMLHAEAEADEALFFPGDLVGPYRISAELGSGAVGRVFEASDGRRTVALKILRVRAEWSPKAVQHRKALFRREVAALAAIEHPNVVRSYGSGEHQGLPWLAMELLEGMTLRELLAGGRLPVAQTERIMFQLCAAVAAVHEAGVIHRDLKPANIMQVEPDQRIVLADFGLAQPRGAPKLEELDPPHFSTAVRVGRQIGTPAYMPPEQTQGKEADMRSDVWSLGAMLYELLAGRRPFVGRDIRGMLTSVCEACPEPLPADLEPYLKGVVYKCLQKNPDWRFPTAREMVETVHDKRLVQLLPTGVDGPHPTPLEACPRCGAPIEHPLQCGRCHLELFRYSDAQVLTVPVGGQSLLACGRCASVLTLNSAECGLCGRKFTDLPPEGQTRSSILLTAGGPLVVDIFAKAIELLEVCPFCNVERGSGELRCRQCHLPFRAYVTSHVKLDLAVGGWAIACGHCGTAIPDPDSPYCPSCGLGLNNGQFPDGTRIEDKLPPDLSRKLDRPG